MATKKINNFEDLYNLEIGDKVNILPYQSADSVNEFFYGGVDVDEKYHYFFAQNTPNTPNCFRNIIAGEEEGIRFVDGNLLLIGSSTHYTKNQMYKLITDLQAKKIIFNLETKLNI